MVSQLQVFKIDRGIAQFNSSDYYAVLGAPVTADAGQIRKRYLSIAKNLHPDIPGLSPEEKSIATKYFSKLVSPAYKVLTQERERIEYSNILKLLAKRLMKRPQKISPQSEIAKRLIYSPSDLEYEKAVESIANLQYSSLNGILEYSNQLSELNLVYVLAKEGYQNFTRETTTVPVSSSTSFRDRPQDRSDETVIQSRPSVAKGSAQGATQSSSQASKAASQAYIRLAEGYIVKQQWAFALKELRSALQINNADSKLHALLGYVYMHQQQTGMAKVSFQQALKLNPQEPLALQYINKVSVDRAQKKDPKKGGFFGWLG